jgi:hypothetical protein
MADAWAHVRESFEVERWLTPFVRAFLSQAHQRVLEWAKKAVELDNVRVAPTLSASARLGTERG